MLLYKTKLFTKSTVNPTIRTIVFYSKTMTAQAAQLKHLLLKTEPHNDRSAHKYTT